MKKKEVEEFMWVEAAAASAPPLVAQSLPLVAPPVAAVAGRRRRRRARGAPLEVAAAGALAPLSTELPVPMVVDIEAEIDDAWADEGCAAAGRAIGVASGQEPLAGAVVTVRLSPVEKAAVSELRRLEQSMTKTDFAAFLAESLRDIGT